MRKGPWVLALSLALAASCGGPAAPRQTPSSTIAIASHDIPVSATAAATLAPGASTPAPAATSSAAPPHVFVIVMENTGLARALRSKPVAAIAARYVLATNYHAVSRPSLPNYLAMTSGSTWGITDDAYHALPRGGLGAQLTDAGITWRAYMDGMTAAGCMRSPYPYALKHDPFAYYGGACPPNVVPIESLDADLAAGTPSFVWVTPDLCHDGHDCPVDQAGAWLDALVARIVASPAWDERASLFITWDEGDGADANLVPLIVATKRGAPREVGTRFDHYSLLATIEDLYGLARLGAARDARPLTELLAGD